jgi:hypothetical protein
MRGLLKEGWELFWAFCFWLLLGAFAFGFGLGFLLWALTLGLFGVGNFWKGRGKLLKG